MLNAVGIDVSKGKSTVSVLQPGGTVIKKPFDVSHSYSDLKSLSDFILHLDGDTRAVGFLTEYGCFIYKNKISFYLFLAWEIGSEIESGNEEFCL